MHALYGIEEVCSCNAVSLQSGDETPQFDNKVWTRLAKWLHKKKEYKPEMLAEPEPIEAIKETYRILNSPLSTLSVKQVIPPELTTALEQNTFIFSGFKTHHELVEASRLLKDKDGNFKPFQRYLKDIEKIDKEYNKNYLRAEYNYATASTQMACKWKEWEQDGDDYDLQYRTAGDDRVREEHAALNKTTLPPSDPFWDRYLPPNGWNCRCTTVQVRKGKYKQSNSEKAIALGNACTAKPKQQIFRFNPGKEMKVFPPKHPYLPKNCDACPFGNGKNLALAEEDKKKNCWRCMRFSKKIVYDNDDVKPPHWEDYLKIEKNIYRSPYHGDNEIEENEQIAKFIAKKEKTDVFLLPRLDPKNNTENALRPSLIPYGVLPNKNADFLIHGKIFEAKTKTGDEHISISRESQKSAIENKIKVAKLQADNIIIVVPSEYNRKYIKEAVSNYLFRSKKEREIWIIWKKKLLKFCN